MLVAPELVDEAPADALRDPARGARPGRAERAARRARPRGPRDGAAEGRRPVRLRPRRRGGAGAGRGRRRRSRSCPGVSALSAVPGVGRHPGHPPRRLGAGDARLGPLGLRRGARLRPARARRRERSSCSWASRSLAEIADGLLARRQGPAHPGGGRLAGHPRRRPRRCAASSGEIARARRRPALARAARRSARSSRSRRLAGRGAGSRRLATRSLAEPAQALGERARVDARRRAPARRRRSRPRAGASARPRRARSSSMSRAKGSKANAIRSPSGWRDLAAPRGRRSARCAPASACAQPRQLGLGELDRGEPALERVRRGRCRRSSARARPGSRRPRAPRRRARARSRSRSCARRRRIGRPGSPGGAARSRDPSSSRRRGTRRSPERSIRFRNCFGMIWSVSTSARSSTATRPRHRAGTPSPGPPARRGAAGAAALTPSSRTSVKWPAIAAAAAIAGLSEVGAAAGALAALEVAVRGRGAALARRPRTSGFMPRHIEQPASRHSKPAAVEDAVEALVLGLALHLRRARDDHARAPSRRRGARATTAAAARRSSMREFVQEPMKTRSTRISASGVPGSSPM